MMSHDVSPLLWFRDDPLPGLLPDQATVIGGTSLLAEFFGIAAENKGAGMLSIAVPFVGDGFVSDRIGAWETLHHDQVELRLVVRQASDAEVAWRQLAAFPWRSLQIGIASRLHAKMYAFLTRRHTGVALIGSHNLSVQGTTTNLEAGVLFLSRRPGPAITTVFRIHNDISRMLRQSRLWFDSTSPASQIA